MRFEPDRGCHHRLEALAPICGDGVEPKARRGRHPARLQRRDQLLASPPGCGQVVAGGAEVKAPGAAGADRVLAVRLVVDATLHAGAAAALSPLIAASWLWSDPIEWPDGHKTALRGPKLT